MRIGTLALIVAACGSGRPPAAAHPLPDAPALVAVATPDAAPPPGLVRGLYYVEAGAPDPLACTDDKECIGDTVTDETGCCIRSPTPYPQTWAWHTWLSKRRQSGVCKIACPPLPIPTGPQKCATETHCAAGTCKNACK